MVHITSAWSSDSRANIVSNMQEAGVRVVAINAVSALIDDEAHAHVLETFVARFLIRMLETLNEDDPAVVAAGVALVHKLLDGGHVALQQLVHVTQCAPFAKFPDGTWSSRCFLWKVRVLCGGFPPQLAVTVACFASVALRKICSMAATWCYSSSYT